MFVPYPDRTLTRAFRKTLTNDVILLIGASDQEMLLYVALDGSYTCVLLFNLEDLFVQFTPHVLLVFLVFGRDC